MIVEILLLSATLIISAYYLWTKNYKHWESKGVPSVPAEFPWGSLKGLDPLKDTLCDFLQSLYDLHENEPVVGFYGPTEPFLLIKNVDVADSVLSSNFKSFHKNGFVAYGSIDPMIRYNSFGTQSIEEWKNIRGIHSPLLTQTKIKGNVPQMVKSSKSMIEYIRQRADENLKANSICWKLAADIALSVGFSVESDSFKSNSRIPIPSPDVLFGSEWSCNTSAYCSLFIPWLTFILRCRSVGSNAVSCLRDWGNSLVENRKKENISKVDFIQRIIEKCEKDKEQNYPELSEDMKTAQFLTLLNDGIETVSNALTSALYHIASHEKVQEKLRDEILTTFTDIDDIDGDDILSLKYLDACLTESLRLRTPIPVLTRLCTEDTKLGSLPISKGTKVFIPIHAMQTDPKNFPDPLVYNPERFALDETAKHTALYSFGGGPRSCLGMRYALMYQKVAICALLLKFKIRLASCPKSDAIQERHDFFFCLPTPFYLKFEPL